MDVISYKLLNVSLQLQKRVQDIINVLNILSFEDIPFTHHIVDISQV